MDERARLLEIALSAAARGWPVLALLPDATGLVDGQGGGPDAAATTDPDRIRSLWAEEAFNVGVATGPANLVVLDLLRADGPAGCDGWAYFKAFCSQHLDDLDRLPERPRHTELFDGSVPTTRTVRTEGGGGRQLYFTAPGGSHLSSTADWLAPMIEICAWGGYVVAAGSVVDGRLYRTEGPALMNPLPAWLKLLVVPSGWNGFRFPSEYALRPENYPR